MNKKSVNIIEVLGSHFNDAVSEPGEMLGGILADLTSSEVSSRYTYLRDVAEGGLKKVTLEKDEVTNREVAVSFLKSEQPEEEVLRFINEAYLNARLEHSNIVPLYDFGYRNEQFFFVAKYLDGKDFSEALKGEADLRRKLEIFVEICGAVSFAHSKGIVHLDLKPANIQVSEHGEVSVFDWGLARDLISEDTLDSYFDEKFAGSPGFTAPEQIKCDNENISVKTDIYSLGAVLFQILSGKIPWQNSDPKKMITAALEGDESNLKQDLQSSFVTQSLIPVCLKALSRSIEERYETVDELKSEVVSFLNGFATQAEDASYFKMLYLLVRRHKVPFSLSLLFLFTMGVTFSIFKDRLQQEQQKIVQLNKSKARVLYNQADNAYKDFRIEEAYKDINRSLELSETTRAKILLGKICLVKGDYQKAKDLMLKLDTEDHSSNRLIPILKKIDFEEDVDYFVRMTDEVLKEHLPGMVLFMVRYRQQQIQSLEERIASARELIKVFNGERIEFELKFENEELIFKGSPGVSRLMPLVGLPLVKINVSNAVLYDISSLRGMKTLKSLNLKNTYVERLDALEGMNLDYLNVSNTCVVDLGVLKWANIKKLDLRGQKVRYLTGLLNMTNIEKVLIDEERYTSHKDRRELKELKSQNRIINE